MRTPPSKEDLNKSRETVDNVMKEVNNAVFKTLKQDDFDTALVKKINITCTQCFEAFTRMHNIQVVPMHKIDAIEHIRKLYRDKCTTWSKDELLEAFCLVQATLGAESFHNELI